MSSASMLSRKVQGTASAMSEERAAAALPGSRMRRTGLSRDVPDVWTLYCGAELSKMDADAEGGAPLTPAERREIAEYQIKLWAEWGAA